MMNQRVRKPSQMSDEEIAKKDNAERIPGLRWGILKDGLWVGSGGNKWTSDVSKAVGFSWKDTAASCLGGLVDSDEKFRGATVTSFSLPKHDGFFSIQKCTPRGPYWLVPSAHGVQWGWDEDQVILMSRLQAEAVLRAAQEKMPEAFADAFVVALGKARN